ncbi:MAG: cytochrome P450 [Actinomycetota bacterium]
MAPTHEPLTDPLLEPGFSGRDPYPHYARLRAEAPMAWNATQGFWALSRYDDVMTVSTDPETFCSGKGVLTMEIGLEYPSPPTMLHTDPPEHTRYRKLVQPAFAPSVMRRMERETRERVQVLVETIEPDEPIEFVRAVSVPFPLQVISDLLGIPEDDWERFFYWSEAMIPGALELSAEERASVSTDMRDYFMRVIDERRSEPRHDVISRLVESEIDGERLTDDELFMFLNQLLVAGNETTRNTISGGLVELSERPDQWSLLRSDRSLLAPATEEILRWTTAVISFMRTATVDTQVGGVDIRAGDPLLMLYASANRDEAQFGSDADVFDVTRSDNHHLAFGFGAHFCIGAALARMEVRLMLDELLDRFSTVEPAGEVERSPSDIIAGVTRAPLVFRA